MIDGLPRRPRPTGHEGMMNQLRTQRGLASGRSKSLRPVPSRTPTPQQPDGPEGSVSSDRLTMVWSTLDIVTDAGFISTWDGYGNALDRSGESVQLSDPDTDDGLIYLFGEGLYCVTVQINASSGAASSDQVVSAGARVVDRPSGLGIACSLRGGDPVGNFVEYHAASTTFYSAGRGLSGGGIEFATACSGATVSADVGRVTLRVVVQKIASF